MTDLHRWLRLSVTGFYFGPRTEPREVIAARVIAKLAAMEERMLPEDRKQASRLEREEIMRRILALVRRRP